MIRSKFTLYTAVGLHCNVVTLMTSQKCHRSESTRLSLMTSFSCPFWRHTGRIHKWTIVIACLVWKHRSLAIFVVLQISQDIFFLHAPFSFAASVVLQGWREEAVLKTLLSIACCHWLSYFEVLDDESKAEDSIFLRLFSFKPFWEYWQAVIWRQTEFIYFNVGWKLKNRMQWCYFKIIKIYLESAKAKSELKAGNNQTSSQELRERNGGIISIFSHLKKADTNIKSVNLKGQSI